MASPCCGRSCPLQGRCIRWSPTSACRPSCRSESGVRTTGSTRPTRTSAPRITSTPSGLCAASGRGSEPPDGKADRQALHRQVQRGHRQAAHRDRRPERLPEEVHRQVLQPLLPGGGLRMEPGAAEEPGQLRQLHRVRRLLHRLPLRQHLVPRPTGRLRRPLPARLGCRGAAPLGIHPRSGTIPISAVSEYDVIIVGGGPAGLAAALYTARMDLKTAVLYRGPLGGQLLNTELVEDYPGFESILGSDLAMKMGDHAGRFGVEVRGFEPVHEIVVEGDTKVVRMESGEELRAPALILAAGGLPRYLEVPGEKEYWGRGVSYCAVCDGAFFKGQELAVIGGGDAAVEEGEFLTRYASRVYILHRRSELRAQPILVERAQANSKIEFIFDAHVKEIAGDDKVQDVLYEQHGEMKELHVGGVFIFIGFVPNSSLLKVHVDHDAAGYIQTDRNMQTSVEGIWAVGDVRAQLTKQIATAVGDGTTAAVAASMYISALKDAARA